MAHATAMPPTSDGRDRPADDTPVLTEAAFAALGRAAGFTRLPLVLDVPGDELYRRRGEHDPKTLERQRG